MQIEIWRDIKLPDIKNLYQVSSLGRVRNKKTKHILKFGINDKGYIQVGLSSYSGTKNFRVNRLVAIFFITNPDNKLEVNHKNGMKEDNRMANLEWSTHSENIRHAIETGLLKYKNGPDLYNVIYTESEVRKICELLQQGVTQSKIRKILSNSSKGFKNLVDDVKYRKSWTYISKEYIW